MSSIVHFALSRESRPFLGRFPTRRLLPSSPCPAWECQSAQGSCVVVETGVGPQRCEIALTWLGTSGLLSDCTEIVSAGFAGALSAGQRIGDVVTPSEVIDASGYIWKTSNDGYQRLLSVPRMIGDPVEKARLGILHDCEAVDMESATIARFCSENGYAFRVVRAISDEVTMALSPAILQLLDGAQPSLKKVLLHLCRCPFLIGELLRLARNTSLAARHLSNALERHVFSQASVCE